MMVRYFQTLRHARRRKKILGAGYRIKKTYKNGQIRWKVWKPNHR